MKRFVVAVCAVLGLSELAPARAQFVFGPPYGHAYGHYSRSGFGFSVSKSHLRVGGFYGAFALRPVVVAPPLLVPVAPFGPFGPVGLAPAPFAPAFFAPGFTVGVGPPPVIVAPIVIGGNLGNPEPNPLPRAERVVLPRGAKDGDFLVFAPKKPAAVPEVTRVEPKPIPLPPRAGFDPFKPPVKVVVDAPDPDPKKEAARQVRLARAAFAAGDYGRASGHFDGAIKADPADTKTHFLLAQTKFAGGEYADAVARVRAGLALDATWPAAPFDPAELYDGRIDRYLAHLDALKKAVADNPGQAALEFLLGYQLWFGGQRAEAEKLFRAAEKRLAAPGPIALFK